MAKLAFKNGQMYIEDNWGAEDIESQAESDGVELTDEQVEEVMEEIVESFDAEIGINWDVISSAIDHVINKS